MVSVRDLLKQKAILLLEGFSNEEIRGAYHVVWNLIDGVLQSEVGRSILRRCKSPRDVFDYIEK